MRAILWDAIIILTFFNFYTMTTQQKNMNLFGMLVFTAYATIQIVDALEMSTAFTREAKYCGNIIKKKLDSKKLAELIGAGYDADDIGFQNVSTHFEKLAEYIGKLRFDEADIEFVQLLAIAHDKIKEDRQTFKFNNGIQIDDSANFKLMEKREHVKKKINKMDLIQLESFNAYINNVAKI